MTKEQLQFLAKVAQPALNSEREFGIPAAVTIAQAIVESATSAGWGTSRLFTEANNPFGIKYTHPVGTEDYGHFDAATWEVENGQRQNAIAEFQRFPNLRVAFAAHARLLLKPRYAPAMAVLAATQDSKSKIQEFAERLGPKTSPEDREHCGYSTNPGYSALLMKLIEQCSLDEPARLVAYASHSEVLRSAQNDKQESGEKSA